MSETTTTAPRAPHRRRQRPLMTTERQLGRMQTVESGRNTSVNIYTRVECESLLPPLSIRLKQRALNLAIPSPLSPRMIAPTAPPASNPRSLTADYHIQSPPATTNIFLVTGSPPRHPKIELTVCGRHPIPDSQAKTAC